MKGNQIALAAAMAAALASPACADVITDWNERAVAFAAARNMGPPPAERMLAMTHAAMFDAVNSIDRKYKPYLIQLPADQNVSREAAAAAAAGTVLAGINQQSRPDMLAVLAAYLGTIPDGDAKTAGVRLGEAVAAKILESRTGDGSTSPDSFRTNTPAGGYVPTPPMWAPQWPGVKPFTMTSGSQFRPVAPIALSSPEWATDYNEIKALGRFDSKTRSAEQTDAARFWLEVSGQVYYPVIRSVASAKSFSVIDNARLFALAALARADAMIAVFDAKYHYNFWRPLTAVRQGDNDGNPNTERDATWRPIAETPMHPEYPCAHCIAAASMSTVLELVLGTTDIPAMTLTSPTAPGVTRRWTSLRDFNDEVSNARIWAGFHYRFSTRIGTEMGRKIGEQAVQNFLQPVALATR